MRAIKAPTDLVNAPYFNRELRMNGLSIIESHSHTHDKKGSMYLQDHHLLIVLEGTMVITHGPTQYTVGKNQMIILNRATQLEFHKTGSSAHDHLFDSLLFFLKDEFLIDFMKIARIESAHTAETTRVLVKPVKERLLNFVNSIKPNFDEPAKMDAGLIRLKMLELLYELANVDKNLLLQLLQLKQRVTTDIPAMMEANYTNPVSVSDLAYLSGRSLSSFKRDFFSIYQMPPAQWIRERRLQKAKELLAAALPVHEVCYSLGFENTAHFSRLFKSFHGVVPSAVRRNPSGSS